jgi:hypothetical protein
MFGNLLETFYELSPFLQFRRTRGWWAGPMSCGLLILRVLHFFNHWGGQVGMHGAGLVNSYFLPQGSGFVEIFPCGTGGSPLFDSFREPHRIEAGAIGVSLFISNWTLCLPYELKPYEQGLEGE